MPAAAVTQLEANITLGGTDYSDEIRNITIRGSREVVTGAGTYGDSTVSQAAGSAEYEVEMTIQYDEGIAADVWNELWTAFTSSTAVLAFTGTRTTGVVSVTNPQFSGNLLVTEIQAIGPVGEEKVATFTFPVSGAITMATS